jgi:hypothetical protein
MTGEHQNQHGWTESRGRRAGSKDEHAWVVQLAIRIIHQEVDPLVKQLTERLDRLEARMDQRQLLARTFTEAREQ